jgi:hypothetical protein
MFGRFAFLPLAGGFLGALFQSWLSRKAETEKRIELLRSEAYADFLKAVAAAGHLRSDDEHVAARRGLADAKARIAVYGSAAIIKALAKFDQGGAVLDNQDSASRFVALVSAMRPDEGKHLDQDISIALLGSSKKSD